MKLPAITRHHLVPLARPTATMTSTIGIPIKLLNEAQVRTGNIHLHTIHSFAAC